ncbi:hypothetical protein [Paenibacillus humicola]|uniref:hypothetical protein n=1 Tax=Paenibacillus humicola TaxID=3110540 RepID=UPI00237C28D8|nr:hypothetical protein [Paenibacillus humicola]
MAWSELRQIPNEYNEAAERIDTELLRLVQERRRLAKGKRFFPPAETVEAWSASLGIEAAEIRYILDSMNEKIRAAVWHEPGELRQVVPLMKRTVVENCEYMLTHAMNHERASIVFAEFNYLDEDCDEIRLKPNLMLAIIGGDYTVRRRGMHGGGPQTKMEFIVSPPLPESLDGLAFSFVPGAPYLERKVREIRLERQVDF